jgi:hypothetical protein
LHLLVEKYPSDAAPMLIDIIVDYLLFPKGDGTSPQLVGIDQKVAEMMADPGRKIEAVKYVRDELKCGLKEAKDYVEQRVWPAGVGPQSEKALELQSRYVQSVLDKIRVDYNVG